MMRNDSQDLEDIQFILMQEKIPSASLKAAFQTVISFDVTELREIFVRMQPIVLDLASEIELARSAKNVANPPRPTLEPHWWERPITPDIGGRSIEKDRELEL
jgi:hypothetical protein